MGTLKGVRIYKACHKHRVYINGKQLSWKKSFEYVHSSSTGFEWGYKGAGPLQLAFAILLELTNEKVAHALYGSFEEIFVAKLPKTNFVVPLDVVMKAIKKAAKNPGYDLTYIPHKEKYRNRYKS